MAATSEELAGQGQQLQQTMSFFRVDGLPTSGHDGSTRRVVRTAPRALAAKKAEAAPRSLPVQALTAAEEHDFERF
jgi:methyl-accepting chemotaxis protein